MVEEGVDVKFRWFRTVQTACESVTLESSDEQWPPIELVWDRHKLMYESEPYCLPCGKHETNLVIDGEKYQCQPFSVVGTTFEVNLFLLEEHVEEQKILVGAKSFQSSALSPLHVDVLWSPASFSPAGGLNEEGFPTSVSNYAFTHSQPVDIYAELVSSKDREINNLRQEIKQLKMCLVEMDAKASLSTAHSRVEASQAQEMSEELTELQKEKKCLEQETESMVSRIKDNEMARESLEWEVQQLRERFCNNDPSEVMQLLVEMKSLREELRTACRKNRELVEEIMKLRGENTRLVKESLVRVVQRDAKLNDSIYFSDDPESGSTQYKELPVVLELSKSLPVLGAPDRVQVPQRSVSLGLGQAQFSSPESNGSVLTDELLSYGTPNKGVQTDITALHGSPTRYRHDHTSHSSLHHESSTSKCSPKQRYDVQPPAKGKSSYFESKVNQIYSFRKAKSFKEEEDSSDTDDLLQEADHFILTTLGSNVGGLYVNSISNKELTNGVNYATSSHTINDSYANPSTVHNYSSSNVFGKIKQAKKVSLTPFIPKCALDLQIGHIVRYHGPHGRVTQGKVGFVGPIPDEIGVFVGIEDENLANSLSSGNPRRTFISFKKVILAWENC